MGLSVDDLIGRVKAPVRSVTICLDAALQDEWDELSGRLEQAQGGGATMSAGADALALAQQIAALEERMRDSRQVFKFKGLSDFTLTEIEDRHPPREGKREAWNINAGAADLVAAAAVEPAMTVEQARRLGEALARSQWDELVSAAWAAATRKVSIPKSVRASALLADNA